MKHILALLFCFGCASPQERAIERNVWIFTELPDGYETGSGVVVKTGYVLTNYHLVDNGQGTQVDGSRAKIVAVDKENDLALLQVKTKKVSEIKLGRPRITLKVFYVGNPMEHIGTVSEGTVIYLDYEHTMTNTIAQPGMSGGGLYDYNGKLVGMNIAMEGKPGVGLTMAVHIPINVIRKFLKEHLQ